MGDGEALIEGSGNESGEEKRDLKKIKDTEPSELIEHGLELGGKSLERPEFFFFFFLAVGVCEAVAEIMNIGG